MKKLLLFLTIPVLIISCNRNEKPATSNAPTVEITETPGFFPVTSYIKGQIAGIKSDGIAPVMITTAKNKTDSLWLKIEQLDSVFAEFVTPEIDSVNMVSLFKENKFHDQTLNSYTFTYEPVKELPATTLLKRWDVYVTPQTGKIKRIYMEKYAADKKELQLNWQSDKSSKIIYFTTDAAGNPVVEKEVLVKWNFDEEEEL